MYPLEATLYKTNKDLLDACGPEHYDWFKERQTVVLKIEADQCRPRWIAEGWTTNGYRIEKTIDGVSMHMFTKEEKDDDIYLYYGKNLGHPIIPKGLKQK